MSDKPFVCDFCYRPVANPPTQGWTYPCEDFTAATLMVPDSPNERAKTIGPLQFLQGAWLACEPCAVMIERGSARLLADYVSGLKAVLRASPKKRRFVAEGLLVMYEGFYQNRTGPRHRPTPGEQFAARMDHLATPFTCHLGSLLGGSCDRKAGIEVRADEFSILMGIEWFPACLQCARINLGLDPMTEIKPDGVKTRALSGEAPTAKSIEELEKE